MMCERNKNILGPRFAIRLSDLRGSHIVTAVCFNCRKRSILRLWELTAKHPRNAYLMDVERRLQCRRCGNREDNRVYVTVQAEDQE